MRRQHIKPGAISGDFIYPDSKRQLSGMCEMEAFIAFVLSNYPLTFLVIGLIAAPISLLRRRSETPGRVLDEVFAYYLLFPIGISFFYNFVMHVFLGEMAANFIGWQNSPFQAEVGFASLGFAVVGFLAFRGSHGLRIGAVIGPALFLLGAAGGHVYQMIVAHNFAPGNAGVIFYMDIVIPVFGFILLGMEHRSLRYFSSQSAGVPAETSSDRSLAP